MKVTADFLGLDEELRKCQGTIPIGECTTELFHNEVQNQCKCVPYASRNFTEANQVLSNAK